MNARLAVEKLVELKASFLNQAKANAERHNRDLFVEIERLRKSFFKMYSLSEETIEQLVSEVVNELNKDSNEVEECGYINYRILSQKRIQSCYNNEIMYGWRFVYVEQLNATTTTTEKIKEVWIDNKQEALNQFLNW